MRKHIFYNTVNFQPVTFRIMFFRGIQTLQMRLSQKACFWWTQLLRPFCRAADELLARTISSSSLLLALLICAWLLCFSMFICAALLWQKEASDIPSKSELLMFLYFTKCAFLAGQISSINPHPAKRYMYVR